MSWTNIQIPDETAMKLDELHKRINELTAEKDYYLKKFWQCRDELLNIPKAVEEYGHVTFYDQDGNVVKLIKEVSDN